MRTTRRTLLCSTAAVGLSGCLGSDDSGDDQSSPADEEGERESEDHEESEHRGHGNDEHEHTVEAPEEPVREADVDMVSDDGHHFEPHLVWIGAGGTVTWTIESGSHTTTAYHPDTDRPNRLPEAAEGWDSDLLQAGETFELTFNVDGVYDYFCVPHEAAGMVASVVVGDPDPHEQPGLEPPQEDLPDEARAVLERLNDAANHALGHTHD